MNTEVKINPFVSLFKDPSDDEKWIVQAPLPGKGLARLGIDAENFPTVFGLCTDFGETALTYLDSDSDLSEAERIRFADAGILLSNGAEPQKPLFSCPLDSLDGIMPPPH